MVNADHLRDASPWQPVTRKIDLKHLLKLIEELGECTSAASRCLMQGIDEKEPVTGRLNREWLEDEMADVYANMALVCQHFRLDRRRIADRADKKTVYLRTWHNALGDE